VGQEQPISGPNRYGGCLVGGPPYHYPGFPGSVAAPAAGRKIFGLPTLTVPAPTLDVGSLPGNVAIALGYVLFVAFVTLLAALAIFGREQYRNGQLGFEPVRCMMLVTIVLLIAGVIRSCA